MRSIALFSFLLIASMTAALPSNGAQSTSKTSGSPASHTCAILSLDALRAAAEKATRRPNSRSTGLYYKGEGIQQDYEQSAE